MSSNTSVLRGPKHIMSKSRTAARTMTTGTAICTLPRGSRVVGILLTGTASDAGTTATLSVGTTTTATELVTGANVLAAGIGGGGAMPVKTVTPFTADQKIYVKYAESGAASAAGAWVVTVLYTEGNHDNDPLVA